MSVSIQELDNTVQAFYEGKGDLVSSFVLVSERAYSSIVSFLVYFYANASRIRMLTLSPPNYSKSKPNRL